jgi:hypothetical protein
LFFLLYTPREKEKKMTISTYKVKLGDVVSFNYRKSATGRFCRRVVKVMVIVNGGQHFTLQEDGTVLDKMTDAEDRIGGYELSEAPGTEAFRSFRMDSEKLFSNLKPVEPTE